MGDDVDTRKLVEECVIQLFPTEGPRSSQGVESMTRWAHLLCKGVLSSFESIQKQTEIHSIGLVCAGSS